MNRPWRVAIAHYSKDATTQQIEDISARIASRIKKTAESDCWGWEGYHLPNGTPAARIGGKHVNVARVILGLTDHQLRVAYSCENVGCLNPAHLSSRARFPPRAVCSQFGCEKEARALGMCASHRRTWLDNNGPECTVEGCFKGQRAQGLCHAHLTRLKKYGDIEGRALPPLRVDGECGVLGCQREAASVVAGSKLCVLHRGRLRRNGEVGPALPLVSQDPSTRRRGSDSPRWNPNPGYDAVHQRVRSSRGPASRQQCVNCGHQAAHWAYDHGDGKELYERVNGSVTPYSLDIERYQPMCSPCHKRFDLAHLDSVGHISAADKAMPEKETS